MRLSFDAGDGKPFISEFWLVSGGKNTLEYIYTYINLKKTCVWMWSTHAFMLLLPTKTPLFAATRALRSWGENEFFVHLSAVCLPDVFFSFCTWKWLLSLFPPPAARLLNRQPWLRGFFFFSLLPPPFSRAVSPNLFDLLPDSVYIRKLVLFLSALIRFQKAKTCFFLVNLYTL